MKIKNFLIFILTIIMLLSLSIHSFAVESVSTEGDSSEYCTGEGCTPGDLVSDTDASDGDLDSSLITNFVVSPSMVMDYSKMYFLASFDLNDCSKVKWYIFYNDGTVFNYGSANVHHASSYTIFWNALDYNGTHPTGSWNNPITVKLTLVVIATSIAGEEETKSGWFTYSWYDNEKPMNSTPTTPQSTTPQATTTPQANSKPTNSDVPHTGL